MSRLARSGASSLRPDHSDGEEDGAASAAAEASAADSAQGSGQIDGAEDGAFEPETTGSGVKEDLSELTETLTRQFWGVASFLAPPPPPPPPPISSSSSSSRFPHPDLRSGPAEIRVGFRTEISKIASTLLPFRSEEEDGEEDEEEEYGDEEEGEGEEYEWTYDVRAAGVTDEVMAFVTNISMHPETWLDFPLFYDFEDCDDFYMSDAQQEHAFIVEHLSPRLMALRTELCPTHMSEGCFWKIYFVLLHSRLNKHDAEFLSTPQIVEARAMLLERLQNQNKPKLEIATNETSFRNMDAISFTPAKETKESDVLYARAPSNSHVFEEATSTVPQTDYEPENPLIPTSKMVIMDRPVINEEASVQFQEIPGGDVTSIPLNNYSEEDDEWPEEEVDEMGVPGASIIPLLNMEDVSFSDLEDDDYFRMPISSGTVIPSTDSQTKGTRNWLQLNKSTVDSGKTNCTTITKTKNELLNIDDIDAV